MSEPRRGLDLPIIPVTEFVPGPPPLTARSAEWGVSVRAWNGAEYQTDTINLNDLTIDGRPITWFDQDNGTGVLLGRARDPSGVPVAVARAVPLS